MINNLLFCNICIVSKADFCKQYLIDLMNCLLFSREVAFNRIIVLYLNKKLLWIFGLQVIKESELK